VITAPEEELFTPSGVRLRRRKQAPGDSNWLLLPGGPGIGSESLNELADSIDVPGNIWLVDLPGDGSNDAPPVPSTDHFQKWPDVLREAVELLPNCIYVGHSTGGMYLLSVPDLASKIIGLVLISSAPDASWQSHYVEMTVQNPIVEVDVAIQRFNRERTNETLREIVLASAPWNFTSRSLAIGRDLLARMPYNLAAVDWSEHHFDHSYVAKWWPTYVPTLIVSGSEDRIVTQSLWDNPKYQGENILWRHISGAGHFPWIDESEAVREAFANLVSRIFIQ
jgi:pimeloyl-ACP methyl ester carboxylesterase